MYIYIYIYIYRCILYMYIYNLQIIMQKYWQLLTTNTSTIKQPTFYRPHLAIHMEKECCDTLVGNVNTFPMHEMYTSDCSFKIH